MLTEMLSRLRDWERKGLLFAGFLLLLMVLDWIIVPKILAECRSMDQRIREAERRLEYCRNVMALAGRAEENYRRIEGFLGKAESSEQAVADFKGQIDDAARRTEVAVQTMENKNPTIPEDVQSESCREYTVAIGSYEAQIGSVLRLVNDLESSPDMVKVTKFVMTPGSQIGWVKGSLEVSKLMLSATE